MLVSRDHADEVEYDIRLSCTLRELFIEHSILLRISVTFSHLGIIPIWCNSEDSHRRLFYDL